MDGTDATRGGGANDDGTDAATASETTGVVEAEDSILPTTLGRLAGSGAVGLASEELGDDGDGRTSSCSRGCC
jgi:hypothetical protein